MAATKPEQIRTSCALAGLIFAVAAPALYITLRLYGLARSGHVDPRLVVSARHMGFVWRCAVAGWFACVCAAIATVIVIRGAHGPSGPAQLPTRLASASVIVAVVLTALALKFP